MKVWRVEFKMVMIMVADEIEPALERVVAKISYVDEVADVVGHAEKLQQHLNMDLDKERAEDGAFG